MEPQGASLASSAALRSSVIPGWGHLYVGRGRAAAALLVLNLALLALAAVWVARFGTGLLELWVTEEALLGLLLLNMVLLGLRVGVVRSSFDLAESRDRGVAAVLRLSAATVMLAVPHFFLGYLTWVQYDLITTVFAPSEPVPVAAATTTTTLVSTTLGSTTTTSIPQTTTTTSPPRIWDGLERLNLLLLGADAGVGRTGVRTDTTIVVSIDPATGDVAMISIPRDLSNAPLPVGMGVWDCNCFPDLITHLYDAAERLPEAFPGPGAPPINALKGVVSETLGIPIHYYAMVTLDGFVRFVDALGGVTIEVPETIVDEIYPHEDGSVEHVVIDAGTQHLDGHEALAYSRIRRHSDDFARMHRQRCVLGAIVEQTSPWEVVANFGALADAIKQHVSTDIPRDRLPDFVELVPRFSTDRIATLRITRRVYQVGAAPGRVFYDLDRIRADTFLLIDDPETAQASLGLSPLQEACTESFG